MSFRKGLVAENVLLKEALRLLKLGISVMPVDGDKKPIMERWLPLKSERPTKERVVEMFRAKSAAGLAILCCAASGGLSVADFDDADAYERWRVACPELAATLPTSKTSPGFHVFFTSNFGRNKKFEGGELIANGYVVAPPSVHASGVAYQWVSAPLDALPPMSSAKELLAVVGRRVRSGRESESSVVTRAVRAMSIADVIEASMPCEAGQRNACLLKLARGLKFNVGSAPDTTGIEHRETVRRWWVHAKPIIATKAFDDSWSEFLHAYGRAHTPLGDNLVERANGFVDLEDLPAAARNFKSRVTRRLIALCEILSGANGGVFFLGCRDAGRVLGICHNRAAKRLAMLVAEGVLELERPGSIGRATRYRFPRCRTTFGALEKLRLSEQADVGADSDAA